jgi:hypothetical protein
MVGQNSFFSQSRIFICFQFIGYKYIYVLIIY